MTREEFLASLDATERAFIDVVDAVPTATLGTVMFGGELFAAGPGLVTVWFSKCDDWRIGRDEVGGVTISTVLLSFTFDDNHFETLASGRTGEVAMAHYNSLDAARAGHAAIVAEARRLWWIAQNQPGQLAETYPEDAIVPNHLEADDAQG